MDRDIASLWIGGTLGDIEIASIHSFLRHGHRLTVYSYEPVSNLPSGVENCDAAEVLPTRRIVRHRRSGSPALHSDLFRYALVDRTDKIWVDLDIIALKKFDFETPYVFGFEDTAGSVNCAVFRMPREFAALRELLKFNEDTVATPPLLKGLRKWKYWLRGMGRGLPIDVWPWGSIGPHALTHFLRQTGEIRYAMPVDTFYAVPISEMTRFITPGGLTLSELPANAYGLHLWGGLMRAYLAEHHGGAYARGLIHGRSDRTSQKRRFNTLKCREFLASSLSLTDLGNDPSRLCLHHLPE